jgi:hypothetical protein
MAKYRRLLPRLATDKRPLPTSLLLTEATVELVRKLTGLHLKGPFYAFSPAGGRKLIGVISFLLSFSKESSTLS